MSTIGRINLLFNHGLLCMLKYKEKRILCIFLFLCKNEMFPNYANHIRK